MTNNQQSETPLLPCPFCGSDAEFDGSQGFRRMSDGVSRTGIAAYCTKCSAQIHYAFDDIPDLTREFVIGLWNTRTDRLAELQADKARLDWLEDHHVDVGAVTGDDPNGNPTRKLWLVEGCGVELMRATIREAIDAALAQSKRVT